MVFIKTRTLFRQAIGDRMRKNTFLEATDATTTTCFAALTASFALVRSAWNKPQFRPFSGRPKCVLAVPDQEFRTTKPSLPLTYLIRVHATARDYGIAIQIVATDASLACSIYLGVV